MRLYALDLALGVFFNIHVISADLLEDILFNVVLFTFVVFVNINGALKNIFLLKLC